jgi:hypothetical protein
LFCISENHCDDGDYHNRAPPVRDGTTRKKKKKEEEKKKKNGKFALRIPDRAVAPCQQSAG